MASLTANVLDLGLLVPIGLPKRAEDHSVYVPRLATNGGFRRLTAARNSLLTHDCQCRSGAVLADLEGAPGRIRTCDTRFRKPLLYPLSYEGAASQRT